MIVGSGFGSNIAFVLDAAFGNPFKLLLVSLEAHFKAAGATFDSVFVWFDSARPNSTPCPPQYADHVATHIPITKAPPPQFATLVGRLQTRILNPGRKPGPKPGSLTRA